MVRRQQYSLGVQLLPLLLLFSLIVSESQSDTSVSNDGTKYGNFASCSDVLKASARQSGAGTVKDGEYLLTLQPYGAVSVYCAGFDSGAPREYLTLVSGRSTNFAEVYSKLGEKDRCQEKNPSQFYVSGGRSEFFRIRINLPQLTVELEDPTFAVNFKVPVGYGTAGDLYSRSAACGPLGRFSVDLRGTPFTVAPNVTWRWQGHYADGSTHGQPYLRHAAYLGCFQDSGDRLFPTQKLGGDRGHMTPATCVQACADAGFRYAGTEYAEECFCGDSYQKHSRAGGESECNMPCSGDHSSSCGGRWRLSVYDTVKGQTVSGKCGGYPGKCFPVIGSQPEPGMQLAVFPQHPCLRRPCQQNELCVLLTAESYKCVPACNQTWCDITQHPVVINQADCPMGTLPVQCRCASNTCVGARFDHNRCIASSGKPQVTCMKGDPGTLLLADVTGRGWARCPNGTTLTGCSYWDPARGHQGNGAGVMAAATRTCSVSGGCSGCTVYARCLTYTCGCENGATCNPVTGRCLCPPGYYGDRCQVFDYCAFVEDHSDDGAPACAVGVCQAIPQLAVRTFDRGGNNQSDTCVFPFSLSSSPVDSPSPTSAVTYTQCVDDNLVGPPFACATYFDGVNDYIDLGSWSPGPVYTLAVWVSPDVQDNRQRMIVGSTANCRSFGLAILNGKFTAVYSPLSSGCTATLQGTAYTPGTWHLLTVSNNGTHLALYVDNTLVAQTTVKPYQVPSMDGFVVGGTKSATSQNFKGSIKSVKIWKQDLTSGEIQNSMHVQNISTSTSEALTQGLVAHYELGQSVNVSCQGVDHAGDDWVLLLDQQVSGVHCNVNKLTIGQGITVTVAPYDGTDGGSFEVYAEEIHIAGYLTAVGSGYKGGQRPSSAGANGLPGQSYHTYNNGSSGSGQQNLNVHAQFFQPHRGGGGGGAGTRQVSATAGPGGGGAYGANGGTAQRSGNGQRGQGGQSYGTADLQHLYLGSGGGSGGNAADLTSNPAGGRGGSGGGSIGLYARGTVLIRGHVSVAGEDGQGDTQQATGCNVCPSACGGAPSINRCYGNSSSACWDRSGPGGGGSGGSLYIRASVVDVGYDRLWMEGGAGGLGGAGGCGGDGGRGRMRVDAVTLRGRVPAGCLVSLHNSTTRYEDLSVGGQKLIHYNSQLTCGNEVYLGCFEDSTSDRHFAYSVPVNSDTMRNMTPQRCMQLCRQKGYKFSATEYGHECFCDNAFNPSKRRHENDCNQACSGDSRQRCGQSFRMSVYGPKPFLPAPAINGALQQCRPWCLTGSLYSQSPSWGYCDLSSQTSTSYNIHCQCPSGFQGVSCDQPCPEGTWGLNCVKVCICNHTNTVGCDPEDGTCICRPGVQGDTCSLPCPPGFFGNKCAGRCSCSETSDCDPVTGQCVCKPGWHGERCTFPCPAATFGRNCSGSCACNQGSCSPEDGTCSCDPGYKLPSCFEMCEPSNYGPNCLSECDCHSQPCDPFTGICKCSDGFQGSRCEKVCSHGLYGKGCQQPCSCQNNAGCDHITGECLCPAGWTGLSCEVACSPFTYGADCLNPCVCVQSNADSCDKVTGVCRCKAGFTGQQCDQPCPDGYYGAHCANRCPCYNNAPCDKRTGQCQCPPGLMGAQCESACPAARFGANCSSICPSCPAGFCSKNNGTCVCTSGSNCQCSAGLRGPQCDQVCQCVHGTCDASGHCQCDPGWEGVLCNTSCLAGTFGQFCSSLCRCQHGNCNSEDGWCTCLPGYQGDRCDTPCSTNTFGESCGGNCPVCGPGAEEHSCDPVTGQCRCGPGYTGLQCDRPCPQNTYGDHCLHTCDCVNGACDNVDGTCECDPGFTGPTCQASCPHGTWGQGCNNSCQCSGHWTTCDSFTGQCQCAAGFTGDLCRETCRAGMWGEDCSHECGCDLATSQCSPVDGSCECLPGYHGDTCQRCPPDRYGVNCSQSCLCSGQGSCDNQGVCDCDPGWQGPRCETQCEQDLKWGKDCRMSCDCSDQHCDFRDGLCRCDPGKQGRRCDQTCDTGHFGLQCGQVCRCQEGARCDPVTGQCHCPEGVDGSLCNQPCPVGRYGGDCSHACACAADTACERLTGQCLCPPGFMGSACNTSCPDGLWDVNCATKCPVSCQAGCLPDTGQCKCTPNSCPPGYFCHTSGLCNINALPSQSRGASSGLGSGQIAGVVVGVLLAAIVSGLLVFMVMRYRNAAVMDRLLQVFKSQPNGQAGEDSDSHGTDNPLYAVSRKASPSAISLEMNNVESDS